MFNSLVDTFHKFHHGQSIQLRLIVPLCVNTVMLFYNDSTFYHYSLTQKKNIYHSKLPGTPYRAVAISTDSMIVSIIETRSIILLNITEHQMFLILSKIPSWPMNDEAKGRQIFFEASMYTFKQNGFLIVQRNNEQRKVKMSYGKNDQQIECPNFITKEVTGRDLYYEKADEISLIVIYCQIPQEQSFKFTTYNLNKNYKQTQYLIQHKVFNSHSIIRSIKAIRDTDFAIFINGLKPSILIYTPHNIQQLNLSHSKLLMRSLYIDKEFNYGVFCFINPKNIGSDSVLQIINLNNGSTIDSQQCTIKQIQKSWQDNYFVDYQRQTKNNHTTTFRTRHLINKKTHYLKLIQNLHLDESPPDFSKQVLQLL